MGKVRIIQATFDKSNMYRYYRRQLRNRLIIIIIISIIITVIGTAEFENYVTGK